MVINMNNKQFMKWILELCSQEGYKNPKEVIEAYNNG